MTDTEIEYRCPNCGDIMYEFNRYTEKGVINKTFICPKCNKSVDKQHIKEM